MNTHELRDGDRLVFRLTRKAPEKWELQWEDNPYPWEAWGPEWVLRDFVDHHARHIEEVAAKDRSRFVRAIQDGAWALASWSSKANWTELQPTAQPFDAVQVQGVRVGEESRGANAGARHDAANRVVLWTEDGGVRSCSVTASQAVEYAAGVDRLARAVLGRVRGEVPHD